MTLHRRAIIHGHCHQMALTGVTPETTVLAGIGLHCHRLESGCCGMAGSFGFEPEHYDVSVAVGERVLLPAVRSAARDTLIVADGFSCREQISQLTGRRALHLADVLRLARHHGPHGPAGDYPERAALQRHEREVALSGPGAALLGIGALAIGAALFAGRRS